MLETAQEKISNQKYVDGQNFIAQQVSDEMKKFEENVNGLEIRFNHISSHSRQGKPDIGIRASRGGAWDKAVEDALAAGHSKADLPASYAPLHPEDDSVFNLTFVEFYLIFSGKIDLSKELKNADQYETMNHVMYDIHNIGRLG